MENINKIDSFIREASHTIYNDQQECLITLTQFMYSNILDPDICKEAVHWVFKRIDRDCKWMPQFTITRLQPLRD